MTEADRQRLAEFDALAASWSEDQRKFGIHQWAMFLRRLITEMEAVHDQRAIELLQRLNDTRVKLAKERLRTKRKRVTDDGDLDTDMKEELVEHYIFNKPLGGI